MPKYALRIATALALLAMIAVIAVSPLITGASDATASNADATAVRAVAIPAQYTEQCSNGTAVPNPADNAGLVVDCAALLASKAALEGASGSLNWSANRTVSGWDGITIANNRVSKLELESYGLDGAIPAELGNLAKLETLNLWNNDITGEMPSELGNLAELKDLDLVSNNLSGAIPSELGNLAKLEILNLWDNDITGNIPAELGNLAKLGRLNLSANSLTGDIPSELGNLANLRRLNLGSNSLSGEIPSALGNLANLWELILSQNSLTGDIPSELGNLANLDTLSLSYNSLTGEIPSELGNLANLRYLYLNRNGLTGDIPSALGNLAMLRTLNIQGNQLTGCIPRSLMRIAIMSDGLPFCAAATTPTPTPTATPTSAPGATATPTAAEQCANGVAVPNPDRNAGLVADCAALLAAKPTLAGARGSLNWSTNRAISDWEGISTANNRVSKVELAYANLHGKIPAELGNLANLTRLEIAGTYEVSGEIPSELGNLANLRVLILAENGLTGEIPHELGNLANLRRLNLAENALSGAIPSELGNLANLEYLSLAENQLTGCIPQSLREAVADYYQRVQALIALPFCAAASPATPTPTATSAPRPPRPTITPTPTSAPRETPVATPVQGETPIPTPTPTATPVQGETPVPTPTPSATPAIVIETTPSPSPTPTATPTSVVATTDNPCINRLTGSGSANAGWTSACVSANPPNAYDYYARFYTFTLDTASEVAITLSSEDAAPYLYLLNGATTAGSINRETGAANANTATITETLQPGAYTIDATTYHAQTPGDFTLEFAAAPAPAASCAEQIANNASVNGAWTPACLSANPPNARDYYARFYTFTLDSASEVTITLSSAAAAPYLYLLNGAGTGGAIERETGAANTSVATIAMTLQPGAYTIEATTYYSETAGDFTLGLEIAR